MAQCSPLKSRGLICLSVVEAYYVLTRRTLSISNPQSHVENHLLEVYIPHVHVQYYGIWQVSLHHALCGHVCPTLQVGTVNGGTT